MRSRALLIALIVVFAILIVAGVRADDVGFIDSIGSCL